MKNLATLNIEKSIEKPKKTQNPIYKFNFKINKTDIENFPIYTWRKISNKVISEDNNAWLKDDDIQGSYNLRKNICIYLRQSRGVKTTPENIIIGSGTSNLLQILLYILPKKSIFATENPGYKSLIDQLEINNIQYKPINLDYKGLKIEDLYKSSANILLTTPSHQFPTGIIMPIDRRLSLLQWANTSKYNYIIEDDYDSEFKYYGNPIPALKSLDTLDNVIYIGNFSKSISPQLRISYMILPNSLLKRYYNLSNFLSCSVPNLNQLILAKFMEEGYFERHLNKMKKIYDRKRKLTIKEIKKYNIDNKYEIIDSKAGLHFILIVKNGMKEEELLKNASYNNIFIQGLNSFYSTENNNLIFPKIIIGYGGMKEIDLKKGIKNLLDSWK